MIVSESLVLFHLVGKGILTLFIFVRFTLDYCTLLFNLTHYYFQLLFLGVLLAEFLLSVLALTSDRAQSLGKMTWEIGLRWVARLFEIGS